jgi:hypothetical protein
MHYRLIIRNQINVYGGPKYNTKYLYDESCEKCGSGIKPIGPRFVKKFKIPNYPIFLNLDREIFVNQDVKDMLLECGIDSFAEVIEYKGNEKLPIWELRAQAYLPPFLDTSEGYVKEFSCDLCGRDGYFEIHNSPLRLKYQKVDSLVKKYNVLFTHELFGNSRLRKPFKQSVFAAPLCVISDKVMIGLDQLKIKGVDYSQIKVV